MNAPLETSPVSQAPPSIALALMAVELACSRRPGFRTMIPNVGDCPIPRELYGADPHTSGFEYYRILDRLNAGKAP